MAPSKNKSKVPVMQSKQLSHIKLISIDINFPLSSPHKSRPLLINSLKTKVSDIQQRVLVFKVQLQIQNSSRPNIVFLNSEGEHFQYWKWKTSAQSKYTRNKILLISIQELSSEANIRPSYKLYSKICSSNLGK